MKTSGIIIAFLLLNGMSVQAQKFYIRGGLGIAVSTAATENYNMDTPANSASILTSNKKGIGTGLPFVLAGGYKINDHFGFELGIDYFFGFSIKSTTSGPNFNSDSKRHGQMLSLVPALVISLPLDKVKPYARLGLKLGIMNRMVYQDNWAIINDSIEYHSEVQSKSKDYGGIAIGAQAAVGTDFALSKRLSLFCEIQVDGISYSPKHGEYTSYIENGNDRLGSMTACEKKWDYVKTETMSKPGPLDQPDQRVKTNLMFGNVGLVLGVKITL